MKKINLIVLELLFVLMMSLPWLVPHTGALALIGFVPLLCAERIATLSGMRRYWLWHFAAFVLWNAATTWWVSVATVGGGIAAVLINSVQMSLIFGIFRLSRRRFDGVLPYILLAAVWIAWERLYHYSQVSWPWLTLGNAFARTTSLVQWYEVTGTLGGSLWVWLCNLGIFGMMTALSDGSFARWNGKARIAAGLGLTLAIAGPVVASEIRYANYQELSDAGTLEVTVAQSNFDPYQKFQSLSQDRQNQIAADLFASALADRHLPVSYPAQAELLLLPETYTGGVWLDNIDNARSCRTFRSMLSEYPNTSLIMGASTHELYSQRSKPHILAREYGADSWYLSYNSALLLDGSGCRGFCHKGKLVVGTELTPWPKLMVPLDDKLGGVMGRCIPQDEPMLLWIDEAGPDSTVRRRIPVGCAICYESVYGEYCTKYVQKGARLLCVITNDGWWGNTPGYRQHFSYSRLRAIELRRDVARSANDGISGFINQRGDVLQHTNWEDACALRSTVNLTDNRTFFARYGDIVGRVCTFVAALMLLALLSRLFIRKK